MLPLLEAFFHLLMVLPLAQPQVARSIVPWCKIVSLLVFHLRPGEGLMSRGGEKQA